MENQVPPKNTLFTRTSDRKLPPEKTLVAACWGEGRHNSTTVLAEEIEEQGYAEWTGASWYQKVFGNAVMDWRPCRAPIGWAEIRPTPPKEETPAPEEPESLHEGDSQIVIRIVELLKEIAKRHPETRDWCWGDVELEIERIFKEEGHEKKHATSLDQKIEAAWAGSKADPTLASVAETLEALRDLHKIHPTLQKILGL